MSDLHQLYRYYDKNDVLLYVGISAHSVARMSQHKTSSNWYSEFTSMLVENHKNRKTLMAAERLAVAWEKPLHNRIFSVREWEEGDSQIVRAWKCFSERNGMAKACGVDPRATRRWIEDGHLPRTEWTGETNYAELISSSINNLVTAEQLLSLDWVAAKKQAKQLKQAA